MKLAPAIITAALALASLAGGEEAKAPMPVNQLTTAIFVEHACTVPGVAQILGMGRREVELKHSAFGTCFAYQPSDMPSSERCLLVTAKHVVAFSPLLQRIATLPADETATSARDPDSQKAYEAARGEKIKHRTRIRIGGMSVQPLRVLVSADPQVDVALIEISRADAAYLCLKPLLKEPLEGVKRMDPVTAFGHPAIAPREHEAGKVWPSAEPIPQGFKIANRTETKVSCAPDNGIAPRGGFSGGPLISPQGERVIAVVTSSTPEAMLAVPMDVVDQLAKDFERESTRYCDP